MVYPVQISGAECPQWDEPCQASNTRIPRGRFPCFDERVAARFHSVPSVASRIKVHQRCAGDEHIKNHNIAPWIAYGRGVIHPSGVDLF
jgi:hypothetical protein